MIIFTYTFSSHAQTMPRLIVAKHIRDEFIEMFSNRMSSSVAKAYHEIQLTVLNGDDMQVIKLLVLVDAQTNPIDRLVYQMLDN